MTKMTLIYKFRLLLRIKDRVNNLLILLSKNLIKFFYKTYRKSYYNKYALKKPISSAKQYIKISNLSKNLNCSEIESIESELGYKIENAWIDTLAFRTVVHLKKSAINYTHGRLLYTCLRNYLHLNKKKINQINILETGTAEGFSCLCMAKALDDSGASGTILTFDLVPHNKARYWNNITDHELGPTTRKELLKSYKHLIDKYIIFFEGDTRLELPKISFPRINFVFIDGSHTYDDVMFEFNSFKNQQEKGDLIIFDDYNNNKFPGIVKAIDEICINYKYEKRIIKSLENKFVITTKL